MIHFAQRRFRGRAGRPAWRVILPLLVLFLAAGVVGWSRAATPPGGTVSPGSPVMWAGTTAGAAVDPSSCVYGANCDRYLLTVQNPGSNKLTVRIDWTTPGTDLDLYLCQGTDSNPCTTQVAQSATGGGQFEQIVLNTVGAGTYYVVIVNFAGGTTYSGQASLTSPPPATATPTPQPGFIAPRYENYAAPNGLGTDAGEPSIGFNPHTGRILFQSYLDTLRIDLDTCSSPALATWAAKRPPNAQQSLDPIMFTDQTTGRTFASQLAGTTSLMSYTDDDGDNWTPSQGGGIASGVDHQTVGGGPWPSNAVITSTNGYPNAIYYCSQNISDARCALSRDGGLSFGPAVSIYTIAQCGGLHGHVKVAPDGTVYVPNKGCGGNQAVVVSTDSGLTWTVRPVPDSTAGDTDPSLGIATDGTIYFGYQSSDGHPRIAVSHDRGLTWSASQDVGSAFGIQNSVFPAVTAGDPNRAAFAFHGTPTGGNYQDPTNFHGVWHLYVAHTYDGGATWHTVDATPTDPVQRGSICTGGTTCGNDRNLLDFFDITRDDHGRVLVGYADGCIGSCVQAEPNTFSALATVARQSGGKGLFAAFDVTEPRLPGAPLVTATLNNLGTAIRLTWPVPDNGGSPITAYRVYRGTSATNLTLLATVTTNSYTDNNIAPATTYYYRVTAVNALGEGAYCRTVTASTANAQSPCVLPGITLANDPAGDQVGAPLGPDVDVLSLSAAEPYYGAGVNKVVFTLKLNDLTTIAPNRRWAIIWNSTDPMSDTRRVYVSAKSNAGGAGAMTFDYGRVEDTTNMPTSLGAADPLSGVSATVSGTIQIVISTTVIGNPQPGATLAGMDARTFAAQGDGSFTKTAAADSTIATSYTLGGNAACAPLPTNTPVPVATYTPVPVGTGTVTNTPVPRATNTPVPIGSVTPCTVRFSDVPYNDPNTYYSIPVYGLACRGVVTGYSDGTYRPFNNTTRGQMSKIVALGFGLDLVAPPPDANRRFADVHSTDIFYQYIETLGALNVTSGYNCGGTNPQTGTAEPCDTLNRPYFRPASFITRGQLTKFVVLAATQARGWAVLNPSTATFSDVPRDSTFYEYIETAVCHGVVNGYNDGTFRPSANAFRGQIAKIVYNAVNNAAACP
jgi:hypothetical protein